MMKTLPVTFAYKDDMPIFQARGYPVPNRYVDAARDEIKRLVQEGIIEKSDSKYASSAFLIEKKTKDL